jgi:RNA polymerase sigma-70 factor (ECF subfamily)
MAVAAPARDAFHEGLLALLPALRAQALALARNRADAADLVQDALAGALAGRDSFAPGTNLAAWMHQILRNRFLEGARRRRPTPLDSAEIPTDLLLCAAQQGDGLALKELQRLLGRLPADQRVALLLVALRGMSYAEVAALTGCAVGTAKSRVFRARQQLRAWLMGRAVGDDHLPTPAVAAREAVVPQDVMAVP